MKIPPVKGTRDFYPPQMAIRNWIVDGWRRVSRRNGFEEYDGPILEYLKMYQIKSGEEIVEQLFSLTDRGGRELAIRPEITPTLARMVNQRINSLSRPIKWFSVPRLCRAERPQKGRLREFFQWNIDIIGAAASQADAEVIFTTLDYLREVGLTANDVKAKISSRRLLAAVLKSLGVSDEALEPLYAVLDKRTRLPAETFEQLLGELVADGPAVEKILAFMEAGSIEEVGRALPLEGDIRRAVEELDGVFAVLKSMGVQDYCVFDPSIVRGLAYYTGVVFEVHDVAGGLRAICGGGRYDNLLRDFGGPEVSATGMGMGDCVLEILLERKGLLDAGSAKPQLQYFVASVDEVFRPKVYEITAEVRSRGHSANFSYKHGGLSKQLKEAAAQNAKRCIIVGQECLDGNRIAVKDMASGQQQLIDIGEFLSQLEVGPDK